MNVTFTRTGERRYRVSVEGSGVISSAMDPATGYDARLPHDMAHFVVENELGLTGGIFGQLAVGGTAGTFRPLNDEKRRSIIKKGVKILGANRDDVALSEKVVHLACSTWNNDFDFAGPAEGSASAEDVKRICREFDAVRAMWSRLAVGEYMTLPWRVKKVSAGRQNQRRR